MTTTEIPAGPMRDIHQVNRLAWTIIGILCFMAGFACMDIVTGR